MAALIQMRSGGSAGYSIMPLSRTGEVVLTLDMGGKEAFPGLPEQVKQTLSIPVEITIRYASLPPCTSNGKLGLNQG